MNKKSNGYFKFGRPFEFLLESEKYWHVDIIGLLNTKEKSGKNQLFIKGDRMYLNDI